MIAPRHAPCWPKHTARHLAAPQTTLFFNAEVSARRHPDKPYLIFYDTPVTFSQFHDEAQHIAGFLERRCGVRAGDRVLLYLQNSPQFAIGYYGILRANAIVVPVSPMHLTEDLVRYAEDSGARTAIVAQELYSRVEPLLTAGSLDRVIVAAYSDYLTTPTSLAVPDIVAAPRVAAPGADAKPCSVALWSDVLESRLTPGPLTSGPDDLCVMPYTSGTTGAPKACMHTHRSVMQTLVGSMRWFALESDTTLMAVAPLFHVTGMQGGMNGPLYLGSTVVLLQRWDRDVAATCVERYQINCWTAVPTLMQDFFSNPEIGRYDLSSIRHLTGGGAAMPAAVAERLEAMGIHYHEGYGLSETMAATHINPPNRPKKQSVGIPVYDVDSRIVDPETLREMPAGELGEIIIHGRQVCSGYWNRPQDTRDAFIERDGKRFLRTGDLGRVDEDGYFFLVDRLKRMINASGFKVWPNEVEALIYGHPGVQEACVIAAPDGYRGETVKALIVLGQGWTERITEQDLARWCREHMAVYKAPTLITFVDALPKSGSGKVLWRELQRRELHPNELHSNQLQRDEPQRAEPQRAEPQRAEPQQPAIAERVIPR